MLRSSLLGLLALSLLPGLAFPPAALAQDRQSEREKKREAEKREKLGRQYTISDQRTGKRLLEAQELLQQEQYAQARELLGRFDLDDLNPYERAVVHQMTGYAFANEEKHQEAAESLKQALAEDALPPGQLTNTRYNLAQLYLMLQRYDEAVAELERWFADTEDPSPSAYYGLASAYYQAGREDDAVEPAEQAVFRSEEPKESWLQLLVALYLDRKRYKEALPLVESLVTRFPKKVYWVQLAAVYFALERDDESFAVQQLAYSQGLLDSDKELRRLAQMYLFNDLPYRAALVLEKGLEEGNVESDGDAWQILGNSWLAAREYEKAIGPLEKAADLSDDGEFWLRLGQVHVQREEWSEAIEAVDKALAKGFSGEGPNTPCHGHLLIGISRYNQKRFGEARAAINRARQCEKTQDMASRWLQFLEREEQRHQALQG